MKKEFRVKSNHEFQKVIQGKKSCISSYVIYYKQNEFEHPRFGISASKKLGNAVTRSSIRRKVRAMLQKILKETQVDNLDYVLIVRKQFLDNSHEENFNELNKLFQNLWRKNHEEKK